ncbi:MAG: hypothetical protein JST55_06505 [Bacteroidetes bacterium]|nr:hypothetical protein [Bacteroidota bacterium]
MNKASLNYLLEFSVIDSQKREEYLNKLLNRKNASGQKNVKLLKIIYGYVDADKINYWNSAAVCKELGIKSGELDTLKSRLLADFREYVFNWEKIEKELRENFKGTDLEFDFLKAKRMNTIGMKKEMKTFHLNIIGQIDKDRKEFAKNYNLTAAQVFLYEYESVETLGHYYYVQKNYPQFLAFYNRLEKLYKTKNKYSISEAEEATVNVRLFLTRSYKHVFKLISDKNYLSALNNLYAAYEIIKEFDLEVYRYGIPLLIALIQFRLSNNEKLRIICNEIAEKADKEGRESEAAVANSYLALLEFNDDKNKRVEVESKIKEYYEICSRIAPYSAHTFLLIKYYVHIMSYDIDSRSSDALMNHALANAVLSSNKAFVFLTYYQIENEKHFAKILRFENDRNTMPEFLAPENDILDNFQKVLSNIIISMRESISPNTLSNIYITFLLIIFLKKGDIDIQYAEVIKGKLHRMMKTRNLAIDFNLYDAITLAFKMQEDFPIIKKADFINKYLYQLKTTCDKIQEGNKNSIYSVSAPYSILYTLAVRLKLTEIWDLLKKYDWREP